MEIAAGGPGRRHIVESDARYGGLQPAGLSRRMIGDGVAVKSLAALLAARVHVYHVLVFDEVAEPPVTVTRYREIVGQAIGPAGHRVSRADINDV